MQAPTATPYLSPEQLVLFKAVEALLSFKPLFNKAVQQVRSGMAYAGPAVSCMCKSCLSSPHQ